MLARKRKDKHPEKHRVPPRQRFDDVVRPEQRSATINKTAQPAQSKQRADKDAPAAAKTFEVNVALPKLPKFISRKRLKSFRISRRTIKIGIAAVIVILMICGFRIAHNNRGNANSGGGGPGSTSAKDASQTPSFAVVLPSGKTIDELGGWTRVSPPDRASAYAYTDYIGNVQINVSEQQLPDDLQGDTASEIAQLAQSYSATDKFPAGKTTVYVGTSSKGVQSLIVAKNNLLILIRSAKKLTNNQWAAYINSLN